MEEQKQKMDIQCYPIAPTDDPYNLQPSPSTTTLQKQQQLHQQAISFQQEHLKHQTSNFYQNNIYYIVSKRWFERWKVYVGYNELINKLPPTKFRGSGRMPELNEDIIDKNCKFKLELDEQGLNVALKDGLREQQDFLFFNQHMWQVINHYPGTQIVRQVVETNQGKKVQIYLQKINAVLLFNDLLKLFEREQLTKLTETTFQVSRYATIAEVQSAIRYKVKQSLSASYSAKFAYQTPIRMWILPYETRKNILMNTLVAGCKANPSFSYKLFIDGQYMEPQSKVSDYQILPQTIIVIQLKQQRQQWVFFNLKKPLDAPCNSCRNVKILKHLCSCKFAAYCSRECKYKDKSHHKFRCPNDAESQEEQKQLMLNEDSRRGIVGLRNLGNTCFMNSGLQCLSNVPQLTEYFLSNNYQKEINKNNPLGTQGQLSVAYAKMIKNLWYGRDSAFSPSQLKKAIAKFQPMFSGYNQHDSGQLVTYLLDGLHEDLNRVINKPYVQSKDYDGRPDEIISHESWQNFLARNRSIIVDLMYGQYRSIVDCPKCQYQSIQFDPFLMCSLPILNNNTKKIQLKYVFNHLHMTKLTICYEKSWNWTMEDVIKEVAKKIQIQNHNKLFAYVASYASCDTIALKRSADEVRKEYKYRTLYVRELMDGEDPSKDIKIILGNTICHSYYSDESYRKNLSAYRMYFINRQSTCREVHHLLYGYYSKILTVTDYQNEIIQVTEKQQPLRILMIPASRYSTCDYCKKKNCDGCVLPYSDQKFKQLIGEDDSKIEMEMYWRKNEKEIQKTFDEKESDQSSKHSFKKSNDSTTIQQCFKLFSQPEILAEDNAWYCPKCKDFVLAKKQMQIYKAPKILILCLKRFKRKQYSQQKFSILVQFPITGLDLSGFVMNSDLPEHYGDQKIKIDGVEVAKQPILYDLIGITNHMGGTGGGHYTAYCKNKYTNEWYDFDDSYVDRVKSQSALVSESAYVLFYKRRQINK